MNGFKNHVKFEHNLICELCDNVFQHKRNLSDHLKVHTQQNWTCKYCKKVFNNVKQLKNHEFIHIDQTCKFCLKEFSSKIQCQKHSGVCTNKYFCTFCNKEMFLKRDLINHVINFHDSTCSKCKKPDIELKQLDNKEEYYNPNLSKNSTYPVATTLNGKEQNKNLLTCKFCRKKFNLKSSLRRHERSHSEVKLYQCKYCSRHFKDNSTCIVHMRTHTGEHPFQCQECPKDFKQLANLKMHIYRHHRKNCKNDKQCNSAKGQPNSKFEQLCSNEMTEKNKGIDLKFQQNSDCFLNPLNINTQSVNIVRIDQRQ
ncbi:hypothetical protein RUM43_014577 [Polyplax serrata]|uniref:C2H2-type domain-containing protein n=1 Tax=Polyplax serrata TaxID=468196 RepID=A0AAN8PGS8_POLSC